MLYSIPFVIGKPTYAEVEAAHTRVTSVTFKPYTEPEQEEEQNDATTTGTSQQHDATSKQQLK
jgi:hypothetical protein